MGSPISSLIAEIFLPNYEDTHIKQFFEAKNVLLFTRHVDGILIIYDKTRIHPHAINTHKIKYVIT